MHFKVYNPDKPDKYGVKSYHLCDSSNGYCCRFEIYTGVNQEPPSAKGKTYDLVMRLMQPYLNVGRCLYVDNYYTSPTLFAELYRQNTGACGTARYRKGIPQEFKRAQVKKKGDKFVMNNGTLLAVKFKDRRVFQMLSSVHSIADVEVGRNHPGTGRPITKPEIVHDYNKFMGAVDRCDQMVAYSCFRRRTMKWWKKVFFHLFFLSILNAYILYKHRTQSPVLQRTFRRELVKELVNLPVLKLSLNISANEIRHWADSNKLSVNESKAKVLTITGKCLVSKINDELVVTIEENRLVNAKSATLTLILLSC